jgi:hypothetical protein
MIDGLRYVKMGRRTKMIAMPEEEFERYCKERSCPHCGDYDMGYEFILTERVNVQGGWGDGADDEEANDVIEERYPKTVKCLNCGKRVSLERARQLRKV